MINLLHSNQQLQQAAGGSGLVVIDIYRESECKHMSSFYKKLPKKFPKVAFFRIDVKSFSGFDNFAIAAQISTIPTILVYCNGQNLVKTGVSSPQLVELLIEHCHEEYLKSISCSSSTLYSPASLSLTSSPSYTHLDNLF